MVSKKLVRALRKRGLAGAARPASTLHRMTWTRQPAALAVPRIATRTEQIALRRRFLGR